MNQFSPSAAAAKPTAFTPVSNPSETLDKYKNSKSISSAHVFGSEAAQVGQYHLNKFQCSQSIPSYAFYGSDRQRNPSSDSTFAFCAHTNIFPDVPVIICG